MTNQEFLLNLKSLRAEYDVQLLTGAEYNRKLLELHVLHAAALLVEQCVSKPAQDPERMTATQVYAAQSKPALALGLTRSQVEWAKVHDWFIRSGIDADGYYVEVVERYGSDVDGIKSKIGVFRDYKALREWAGY